MQRGAGCGLHAPAGQYHPPSGAQLLLARWSVNHPTPQGCSSSRQPPPLSPRPPRPPRPREHPPPAPCGRYYFAGAGANVTVALKDAGLVDIDTVLAQAVQGKEAAVGAIAATYTFRCAARRRGGVHPARSGEGRRHPMAHTGGVRARRSQPCMPLLPAGAPRCRAGPRSVLARLDDAVAATVAAVNGLVAAASREEVRTAACKAPAAGAGCIPAAAVHASTCRVQRMF